jgi:hypothetical protein
MSFGLRDWNFTRVAIQNRRMAVALRSAAAFCPNEHRRATER